MKTVEDRYQAGSTTITSQFPADAWHAVIGFEDPRRRRDGPTFTDAILNRLIHNAQRHPLDGPSLRKTHNASIEENNG